MRNLGSLHVRARSSEVIYFATPPWSGEAWTRHRAAFPIVLKSVREGHPLLSTPVSFAFWVTNLNLPTPSVYTTTSLKFIQSRTQLCTTTQSATVTIVLEA